MGPTPPITALGSLNVAGSCIPAPPSRPWPGPPLPAPPPPPPFCAGAVALPGCPQPLDGVAPIVPGYGDPLAVPPVEGLFAAPPPEPPEPPGFAELFPPLPPPPPPGDVIEPNTEFPPTLPSPLDASFIGEPLPPEPTVTVNVCGPDIGVVPVR